jgi:hypothetical protein
MVNILVWIDLLLIITLFVSILVGCIGVPEACKSVIDIIQENWYPLLIFVEFAVLSVTIAILILYHYQK